MNKFLIIILMGVLYSGPFAADLVISGQTNKTYQNQTYGHLKITNSSAITIKNCMFATSYATNAGGGIADISGSNHITIDSCDFKGDSTTCTGMNISGSYITIRKCIIHDIADDAFQCGSGDHIYFLQNTICHLYGCGTDAGCGPCYNGHSDGFELSHLDTVVLSGNLVYDVRSTSALFPDNYSGGVTVRNLMIDNNIFYTPETGVIIYAFYVDGLKMYNNTVWKSNWLGIAVGPSVTRLEAYNNITMCIDYNFMGGTYNAAQHKWDYNLVGFANRGLALQPHDVSNGDPKFRKIPIASDNTSAHVYRNVTPADFELMAGSPAIGKAMSGGSIPTVDFYGRPRTAPYDMGAITYQSTGIGQPISSKRSSENGSRFPSMVFAKHNIANGPMAHASIYDLYGRKINGKTANGCLFLRRADGGIQRIMVVP